MESRLLTAAEIKKSLSWSCSVAIWRVHALCWVPTVSQPPSVVVSSGNGGFGVTVLFGSLRRPRQRNGTRLSVATE